MHKYEIYHSVEAKNGGKRKWSKTPSGCVILTDANACLAAAEDQAIIAGIAAQSEFNSCLNSSGFWATKNTRAAKAVYAGNL